MNDTNQNEFINNLFSVNFVLICSERVKQLSIKIPDLFKQFNQVNSLSEKIRDPISNHSIKITNLTIKIRDVSEFETSSSNSITLKRMLMESVQKFDVFDPKYETSLDTPWFDEWKTTFLNNFEICEHEFIGANFGSIFAITVDDLSDVKNLTSDLYTQVKQQTNIKWFQPAFFKYFVVINVKNGQDNNYLSNEMKLSLDELFIIHGEKSCFWLDIELNKDFSIVESNDNQSNQHLNQNSELNSSIDKINSTETSLTDISAAQVTKLVNNNNNQNELVRSFVQDDPLSPLNSIDNLKLEDDDNDFVDKDKTKFKTIYNESLILKIETLLKNLVNNALIPWSEKQIKQLNETISFRSKGFKKSFFSATKQFLQMSSSTVNLRGIVQNNITYSSESNEMQNRKLADMAMCLRLYDLASNFYCAARKDFQNEGAWIYFAGACEGVAMSSYLNNKFQKNYFDQAIQVYLDTCKSMSLATRTTLISTDIIRKIWPFEASSYFIKLTSEDSNSPNLRSALFLEQAAKCFMQSLPAKRRRAAFHYVLAGHRFNRSNLKKHALFCYLKYNATTWKDAYEHASQTRAKLYLQISSTLSDEQEKRVYRLKGLSILRDLTSFKEQFLKEFLNELNKQNLLHLSRDLFELKIPKIKFITKESNYDDLDKNVCFVNEQTPFFINTYSIGFKLELKNFCLLSTDQDSIEVSKNDLVIEANSDLNTINCWIKPKNVCEFELYGIEFQLENITFIQRFDDSIRKSLKFKSISTLPLINCNLYLNEKSRKEIDALEAFSSELIDLTIDLTKNEQFTEQLTTVRLITNANLTMEGKDFQIKNQLRVFNLELNCLNQFKLNLPYLCRNKNLEFKIEYSNGKLQRSIKKYLQVYVKECLQIDHFVKSVISLRNILPYTSLNLRIPASTNGEQPPANLVVLKPGCVGHFLIDDKKDKRRLILWNTEMRNGCIDVDELGI